MRDPVSSADFTGWAWGADVVGWISFNCKNSTPAFPSGYCSASNHKVTFSQSAPLSTFRVVLIASPKSGSKPLSVNLIATAYDYDASRRIDYVFDCGNGQPTTSVTHATPYPDIAVGDIATATCTYASSGKYTAEVTATQRFGVTDTAKIDFETISVLPPGRIEGPP